MGPNQVRSKSGCLRCRQRRRKCDEVKPICSFCARWNLDCLWAKEHEHSQNVKQGTRLKTKQARLRPTTNRRCLTPPSIPQSIFNSVLDPFHKLPIPEAHVDVYVTNCVSRFFTLDVEKALGFDMEGPRLHYKRSWMMCMYGHASVCYAVLALCTSPIFCSQRRTSDDHRHLFLQIHAHTQLRNLIETAASVVSKELIVAAGVHFMSVTISNTSDQVLKFANGFGVLLTRYISADNNARNLDSSVAFLTDVWQIFTAKLTGRSINLDEISRPVMPLSLQVLFTGKSCYVSCAQICESDVAAALEDIRLLLFFRQPSKQKRRLSESESWSLMAIWRYVDAYLVNLQAHYLASRSISEVMVLALMLIESEVILESPRQLLLISTVLGRLRRALQAHIVRTQGLAEDVLIWASFVGLSGKDFQTERRYFLRFIVAALDSHYGDAQWPLLWRSELRDLLQRILWHKLLDMRHGMVCSQIQEFQDTLGNQNYIVFEGA